MDEVKRISYESDVLSWLDDCIKEVARVPQIREILAHYQALLRRLTGKSTGELVMDLKELLKQKQGDTYNFQHAATITEAMAEFSIEAEWKFWCALQERLREKGNRPWQLELLTDTEVTASGLKEVKEEVIRNAHGISNKSKWLYGRTFRIKSDTSVERYLTDNGEVFLRVECDNWGWGFYGFIAVKSTANRSCQLSRTENKHFFEDWGKQLSTLEEERWRTSSDSWVAWAWPTEDLPLQKSNGWLTPDAIRLLLEGQAVDSLVGDIHTTINKLEGWEEPVDSDPDKQRSGGD